MPQHVRYRILTAATAIVVGLGLAGYAPAGVAARQRITGITTTDITRTGTPRVFPAGTSTWW